MITVLTPDTTDRYGSIAGTRPTNQRASGSDMDWAAVAEVRKPARVTPIWIVARKLELSSVSFRTILAFLCPSSAIFRILLSFREMMAISDAAKKALTRIRTNIRTICQTKLPGSGSGSMKKSFPFQTPPVPGAHPKNRRPINLERPAGPPQRALGRRIPAYLSYRFFERLSTPCPPLQRGRGGKKARSRGICGITAAAIPLSLFFAFLRRFLNSP